MSRRTPSSPPPSGDETTRTYRWTVALCKAVLRMMSWRVTVIGDEHLPNLGPALVAANHVSYLDPIILGYAIDGRGRAMRYLAKRELFDHWLMGPLVRGACQIPVDRRADPRAALEHAEDALTRGQLVALFPEGTIPSAFDAANAKTGAARLALSSGAPLIPAAVWGGQRIHSRGGRVRLARGVPLVAAFAAPVAHGGGESPEALTARLMSAIGDLVEQAARRAGQPLLDGDERWLPHRPPP